MENEREVMKSLVENIYTEEITKLNKEVWFALIDLHSGIHP
jgi:hypothetical protein